MQSKQTIVMRKEIITLQTLAESKDIHIGYSDEDIIIIDSIQKFAEVTAAHVAMNVVAICINGKIQGIMNGQEMELHKNQIAVMPPNITVSDMMFSPDFDLKAMCFTNTMLQAFLREKMNVWNEVMYIHHNHIFDINEEDMPFFSNFYDMFRHSTEANADNPYRNEIIQSLLRCGILQLCGTFKQLLRKEVATRRKTSDNYFQRFLELLSGNSGYHQTVESYAQQLCITPKYLSFICKQNSGKTANKWITERTLEEIRYYLRQTDLSIKQIADTLGFPNPSFFGKYVKEHFGMTPVQVRENGG